MTPINWCLLGEALTFYIERGFTHIDVPWIVSREVSAITCPPGRGDVEFGDGALLASGEQGFLQLRFEGSLQPGRYVTLTPCFRDEERLCDETRPYFAKVELIDTLCGDDVVGISDCALEFIVRHCPARFVETVEGVDIFANDVELGSFGTRFHPRVGAWAYGTGAAEPRLSIALNRHKLRS